MSDQYGDLFKSQRGGIKLYCGGYAYEKNRVVKEIYYWVCECRKNDIYKCNVSIVSKVMDSNDQRHDIIKTRGEHNHEPDPLRKEIADFSEKIKKDAASGLKVCQIVQNNKSEISKELLENLPSTSAIKQMIYRAKSKEPKLPEAENINFTVDKTHTQINGQDFIIKDQIFDENKRVILFSTKKMMQMLQSADFWVLDGTFKVVPSIFQQLYTIHGNISETGNKSKTFPLLFCLSTNKCKRSYDVIFNLINEYGSENNLEISPKICILDFEKAAIMSLRSNYENITLHGCNFHLGQILYRQIQNKGLATKYAKDIKFNTDIKCIMALSFLPAEEIPLYFNKLLKTLTDEAKDFAYWFESNYVSGTYKSQPKYDPEYWSCDIVNQNSIPRTQNSAEAWHHHINQVINKKQPKFYCLVRELIKEAIIIEDDIEKMICGAPLEKKRKMYVIKEEKLKKIIDMKDKLSEIQYLKTLAKHLTL